MAFFALIPAAGSGSRIASVLGDQLPKQYRRVAGKPMIQYALEAFAACKVITASYVVVAADDTEFDQLKLNHYAHALKVGGETRYASVLNGLRAIEADEDDWILVHDAARPGLTVGLIDQLIESLSKDSVGGLLAMPVADTLKQESDGHASQTVSRDHLWQAQTPQMFRYGLLFKALQQAGARGQTITDEASAIEAYGFKPKLVIGSARNFKVTQADDLELAECLLGHTQTMKDQTS